jgi:hypothetical protein
LQAGHEPSLLSIMVPDGQRQSGGADLVGIAQRVQLLDDPVQVLH